MPGPYGLGILRKPQIWGRQKGSNSDRLVPLLTWE